MYYHSVFSFLFLFSKNFIHSFTLDERLLFFCIIRSINQKGGMKKNKENVR